MPARITQKIVDGIYSGVTTSQLDELAAETCAYNTTRHTDFAILAARIAVSSLHKNTLPVFSDVIAALHNYVNPRTGERASLIADDVFEVVQRNRDRLNAAIDIKRDFQYDYFGFKTLERSYLLKLNGAIAETPQHMLMRVSVGIHKGDVDGAIETYNLMSGKWFTHASPTLFNAGTPKPQMSSCFLLQMQDDSIEGIYDTLKQCAQISKSAGGIGLSVHNIRARGSYISGTNGESNGLVPMLRVFNDTARYVDQGGGKRKGAFAVYLEPWHADIFEFLDLKKPHGAEENRARDLFYALWICDLFMERVEKFGTWSLMCPHECPGLAECHGDEFVRLYTQYEQQGKFIRQVPAQKLWMAIIESQIETGTPYMLYKDAANRKSNQQHLGTIQSSNLCTEIMEYTSPDEVAVCNLASIALTMFVCPANKAAGTPPSFDFDALQRVAAVATRNLNKIIDGNYYPVAEARNSNLRHRPIGLGVQGLADTFCLMRMAFDSPDAAQLNKQIFETIYFAALTASNELAARDGPYESFAGSPASSGILQFDMWGVTPPAGRHDWAGLKQRIMAAGLRNSLLLAPMPTASTSQILGNNECIEPFSSNMYARRVLAGEFQVVNSHLLNDLIELGLWNEDLKQLIVAHGGSVQRIDAIPADIKVLYKTVWEIKQRIIVDMAADRGAYIDQSQSLNIHMADAKTGPLTSMHFHGWRRGLKTGMYYLRTRPAVNAIKFTVDVADATAMSGAAVVEATSGAHQIGTDSELECSLVNRENCVSCGS